MSMTTNPEHVRLARELWVNEPHMRADLEHEGAAPATSASDEAQAQERGEKGFLLQDDDGDSTGCSRTGSAQALKLARPSNQRLLSGGCLSMVCHHTGPGQMPKRSAPLSAVGAADPIDVPHIAKEDITVHLEGGMLPRFHKSRLLRILSTPYNLCLWR